MPPGGASQTIVAEITNTPWGERHQYVLPVGAGSAGVKRFEFAKDFHVSPFMPMEMQYHWRFTEPGDGLVVHMQNFREGNGSSTRPWPCVANRCRPALSCACWGAIPS